MQSQGNLYTEPKVTYCTIEKKIIIIKFNILFNLIKYVTTFLFLLIYNH